MNGWIRCCLWLSTLVPVANARAEWDARSYVDDDGYLVRGRVFELRTDVDASLDSTTVTLLRDGNELDITIVETRNGQVIDVDKFDIKFGDYDIIEVFGGPNVDLMELVLPLPVVEVWLVGGLGNDDLRGPALYLSGSSGNDRLFGGVRMIGGEGNDYLKAGPMTEYMNGYSGRNLFNAAQGTGVKIFGGVGNDTIIGSPGNDVIDGYEGDDVILGGAGDDDIRGGGGIDALFGEDGHDRLDAGNVIEVDGIVYREMVYGNNGRDTFQEKDVDAHYNDYDLAEDSIVRPFRWYRNVVIPSKQSFSF